MKKSVMMIGVLLIAMSVSSCISSVTMVAGVGNSLGPLNDLLNSQQEGNIKQAGPSFGELQQINCNKCQQTNWQGSLPGLRGSTIPCSEIKAACM